MRARERKTKRMKEREGECEGERDKFNFFFPFSQVAIHLFTPIGCRFEAIPSRYAFFNHSPGMDVGFFCKINK